MKYSETDLRHRTSCKLLNYSTGLNRKTKNDNSNNNNNNNNNNYSNNNNNNNYYYYYYYYYINIAIFISALK